MPKEPDRNLALELVQVTEAAAVAAAKWQGRGDRDAVDQAAADAMRSMLATVAVDAIEQGLAVDQVLSTRDLVNSENTFFAATGVATGSLLGGVQFLGDRIKTRSVVMQASSGTIRFIEGIQRTEWIDPATLPD